MKVGIDAFALSNPSDGTQTYVRNVIRALHTVDPTGDYTLFVRSPCAASSIAGAERMTIVTPRSGQLRSRLPFGLSRAIARSGVDVLHVQFAAPLVCPARIVVTVHDILFERYPQFFHPTDLRQLRLRVPLTLRRAAAVLTVSEFSRQDIARRYRVPLDKIVVTPNAADPLFRPIHDAVRLADVRSRYNTSDHFVLFVGVLKPNKNVKTLVESYVRLRRAGHIAHRLVLVGSQDSLQPDVLAVARDAGCAEELIFTGHVADDDLVALYNAADLFVQPSIFEGFGLPALEAMACGTPVVTSSTSAIPEVVGDAAILVDPLDADELANAMATVLSNDAMRMQLSQRGLEQAARFTWENSARTIVDVYHKVGS